MNYKKLLSKATYNNEAQAVQILLLKEKARLREKEIAQLEAVILKLEVRAKPL